MLRILEQVCGITSLRFLKYLTSVGPLSYRQYSYRKTCIWISRYFIFSKKRSLNGCCLSLTKFRRKYFACWSSLQESLGIFWIFALPVWLNWDWEYPRTCLLPKMTLNFYKSSGFISYLGPGMLVFSQPGPVVSLLVETSIMVWNRLKGPRSKDDQKIWSARYI